MDELDMSKRLAAFRRHAGHYRRQLVGGVSLVGAAAATLMLAAPALAHDGMPKSTPTPCATSGALTTPCAAPVVAGATGAYSVTLPGIGTLNITVDPTTNLITAATFTLLDATFTASAVTINEGGNKASVTLTSVADPTVVYNLKAKVKPPTTAGGAPTVTAKVKSPEKEDADETGESAAEAAAEAAEASKPVSNPKGGGEHHGGSGGGGND